MKKLIYLSVVGIIIVIAFTQLFDAQEMTIGNYERKLQVQVEKSSIMLLEPVAVKFDLTLPASDGVPQIVKAISVRTTFEGKSREFRGLTLNTSLGEPQALPAKNSPDGVKNAEPKSLDTAVNYSEEEIIDRVGEFFPRPGNYQVQFFLSFPGSNTIESNVLNITVEEPTGVNKNAFDFLNKYENAPSFYWVWKEKNGISLLEDFVDNYGESVYGESAILYLGGVYKAKDELDKAQGEFEKIRLSSNKPISDEANKALKEIEQRRMQLNKPS